MLDSPRPLWEVAEAISGTGLKIVSLEHAGGGTQGGFLAGVLANEQAIDVYRKNYGGIKNAEPGVFAVRLAGRFDPRDGFSGLSDDIVSQRTVPPEVTVNVSPPEEGGAIAADPQAAPTADKKKPWAPESGRTEGHAQDSENRKLTHKITFSRASPGSEFKQDWAYEHDFKLINRDNPDSVICPIWKRDNFWISRSGMTYDTDMPDPYLDTEASDNCQQSDLTIGSYHPAKFRSKTYTITMSAPDGRLDRSPFTNVAAARGRQCGFDAWCVGLPWHFGDDDVLIGETKGSLPGCRAYKNGVGSHECVG